MNLSEQRTVATTSLPQDAVSRVQTFHAALNAHDIETLVDLAADDIMIGGPRGRGQGKDLLREWFARANATMQPKRWFGRGEVIVVEQSATWHDAKSGKVASQRTVASAFGVQADRIVSLARYADLGEALTTCGLTEADQLDVARDT